MMNELQKTAVSVGAYGRALLHKVNNSMIAGKENLKELSLTPKTIMEAARKNSGISKEDYIESLTSKKPIPRFYERGSAAAILNKTFPKSGVTLESARNIFGQ